GDVNVFHGRVAQERAVYEDAERKTVGASAMEGDQEVAFVRPHDLELSRSRTNADQFEATVQYVLTAGSRVRIELIVQGTEETIEVDLSNEQYRELKLSEGELVFVHPIQRKVFKIPQA